MQTTVIREVPRQPAAATFEVTHKRALLWVYAPEPLRARVEVQIANGSKTASSGYQTVSSHTVRLRNRTGRTGVVDVKNLEANRRYRYRANLSDGRSTKWHWFRTAPLPTANVGAHFLVGADISNDPKHGMDILERMAATGADFMISLGDWPYTDVNIRDQKVDEYRLSHRAARLAPEASKLFRSMSIFAIYDDHEIRDNWDGSFRLEEPDRLLAGLQVWDEFFPLRARSSDPLTKKRYRSLRWGKHIQLIFLDTRLYRSAYRDIDSPEKTMLGAEQKQWLLRELSRSGASFKLVLTSIPLAFGTTADHWSAYAFERDEILTYIRDRGIRGVVFLTADQHWFAAHRHPGKIHELQVGPLASYVRPPPTDQPPEVLSRRAVRNYGEIIITAGKPPRLVFTARDPNGALIYADVINRR